MADAFDVVVLGTGSAGTSAAARLRAAGRSVAIVDVRPYGGTCALRGCDPKKVLVGVAELVDHAQRMQGHGLRGDAVVDFEQLMAFKRTFTDPVPSRTQASLEAQDIATYHGSAWFLAPGRLMIGSEEVGASSVVVATGAEPRRLGIPGEELLIDSERFLDLDHLPERIVFVGGGYISFEFAHIAARAGARPTIVHGGERPLKGFDPDLVDRLVSHSRAIGVEVRLGARVASLERRGDDAIAVVTDGPNGRESVEADLVVHGAGREPALEDLHLENAGIAYSKAGVTVNEFLQSVSNPSVYAAGDSADTGVPRLTPVAGQQGRLAAENLLGDNRRQRDAGSVPTVVFTIPALAAVGLTEEQAHARGLRVGTHHEDTDTWYTSRRIGEQAAAFKVIWDQDTDRIVGAHLLGAQASEVINLFQLAIRFGLTRADLRQVYAYPTATSDIVYML